MQSEAIRFWGVRGSIATPGPRTTAVGGNTSCVEVQLAGQRILLDGGTGLRALGQHLAGQPVEATLLFGHLHWDHIQGVPFFGPLFHPGSRVRMVGPPNLERALHSQMAGPMFPVAMDVFNAGLSLEPIEAGQRLQIGEVQVTTAALNHPGGGIGYRLQHGDRSVVYAVDTEHPPQGIDPALLELARGAEVLIYDAQYLPEEYPMRVGWGHSTPEHGVALALAAGVRTLVLTHHDPARDDLQVLRMEQQARREFPSTWAAREGLTIELEGWSAHGHAVDYLALAGAAPGRKQVNKSTA